jgi:hypothetical protein
MLRPARALLYIRRDITLSLSKKQEGYRQVFQCRESLRLPFIASRVVIVRNDALH